MMSVKSCTCRVTSKLQVANEVCGTGSLGCSDASMPDGMWWGLEHNLTLRLMLLLAAVGSAKLDKTSRQKGVSMNPRQMYPMHQAIRFPLDCEVQAWRWGEFDENWWCLG